MIVRIDRLTAYHAMRLFSREPGIRSNPEDCPLRPPSPNRTKSPNRKPVCLSCANEIARCARSVHAKMADRFGEAFHRMRHVL